MFTPMRKSEFEKALLEHEQIHRDIAIECCTFANVLFLENYLISWSDPNAPRTDMVNTFELSYRICEQLEIAAPGRQLRDPQAAKGANVAAILRVVEWRPRI